MSGPSIDEHIKAGKVVPGSASISPNREWAWA
jgi:hypothetical protein